MVITHLSATIACSRCPIIGTRGCVQLGQPAGMFPHLASTVSLASVNGQQGAIRRCRGRGSAS